MGVGKKEYESSAGHIWAAWISSYYSLFLLCACFETYESFISLIFQFLREPQ
jgi:hypothetical protein